MSQIETKYQIVKKEVRIETLERIAKERYIENTDWDNVLNMLDEEELKEYNQLKKELGMTKIEDFLAIIQNATNNELHEYLKELENEISRSNNAIAEGFEEDK